MATTITNRAKYRALVAYMASISARATLILGTATGVSDPDLNTVADLDAVSGVSIHTERLTLASVATTEDDVNNRAAVDADNLLFAPAVGVTAVGLVVYAEGGGTDATREIIGTYVDGFPQPVDGGLAVNISDFLRGT